MADNSRVKKLVEQLEKAIKDGLNLFNYYKELSKEFQEQKKDLMNNKRFEKTLKNELNSIKKLRKELFEKTTENENIPNKNKAYKLVKLGEEEKHLKSQKYKQEYKNMVEKSLVNSDKKFLKEKKKITDSKKIILKKILDIGKEIKSSMNDIEEFKKFVNKILKRRFKVFNGKTISFDILMHHLKSGEISNEVSKTTKQIDELMTTGNVVNRKKKMEIGILKKEIKNLLIDYDTTMSSLKKFVAFKYPNKENITNEDVESLLKTKYTKENSPEFREKIYNLASKLKKYNSEVKTKMRELKKLQASS